MTQICVFNTRLFSLHNALNHAIHRACLRMVLLMDVYRNLTAFPTTVFSTTAFTTTALSTTAFATSPYSTGPTAAFSTSA